MASDYRSQLQNNVPKSQVSSTANNRTTSYAAVTQNDQFPKKDQGIVLEAKDGIPLKDYIFTVGNIVKPENIRFASRISNNRICLFLATKEIVEEVTSKGYIMINNILIQVRPLITKHKRVILSNVSPTIPHIFIEEVLDSYGIKRGSSVSFLKVGVSEPGYAHVISFRRQVYIHPEDLQKLPDSIKINHDETTYWIYLSTDSMKCFICKENGHAAKNCPTQVQTNTVVSDELNIENSQQTHTIEQTQTFVQNIDLATQEDKNIPMNSTDLTQLGLKRTHSEVSSADSLAPLDKKQLFLPDFKKPPAKEAKIQPKKGNDQGNSLDDQLEPIKSILDEPDSFLNYLQFKSLLENMQGATNPLEIAKSYTNNIQDLITFMKENLYPHLTNRAVKSRITRITKRLSKVNNPENNPAQTLSDEESSTQEESDV